MKTPDVIDELRYTSQPLPRIRTPLPDETTSSYLHRLASANLMDPEVLRIQITGDYNKTARPRLAVLSRLSSQSEHTLLRALPELSRFGMAAYGMDPSWPVGPGCRPCNAARGVTGPAWVWHAPESVLCLRHRRWTTGVEQPDLTDQPEILAAHRAYRRLARAHGHKPVRSAYLHAARIIEEWRDSGSYNYTQTDGFDRRIRGFLGPDWRVRVDSPLATAAKYPQVVALTRLLASPYWTNLALCDHIAAGRPDKERAERAAHAIFEQRRTVLAADDFPEQVMSSPLAAELAEGYLLPDGPSLRIFLDEVRRTVEPRYKWSPIPKKFRLSDLHAQSGDPLVDFIGDRVQAARVRLANFPETP